MPASARVFLSLMLVGWTGGWLAGGPAATAPAHPARIVTSYVPAATTTTAAPVTTTTTPVRASRGLVRPRPPAAPNPPPVGCDAWGGGKTRAQSDTCWAPELAKYAGWSVPRMLAIIWCESHGDAWSVGARRYVGLLQIDGGWSTQGNGAANIALGHQLWLSGGYGRWPVCQYR